MERRDPYVEIYIGGRSNTPGDLFPLNSYLEYKNTDKLTRLWINKLLKHSGVYS